MYKIIKRMLDAVISFLMLAVGFLPMLLVGIAVKADSPGPAIFKQERLGKNGKPFTMYKFRSMKVDSEHTGSGVYSDRNDPRVTKFGRFLRASSIDELPQLLNILKGDMSFIGPRPVLTYHPWKFEEYSPAQKKRFEVRPGITGWAQVNGRKTVKWQTRLEYDAEYVDGLSLKTDLKILKMTIAAVLGKRDNENTQETV